jgi:hypothetical protein
VFLVSALVEIKSLYELVPKNDSFCICGIWTSISKISFFTPNKIVYWPVHLLSEDVSSREDAYTSWPSTSGLRDRSRT